MCLSTLVCVGRSPAGRRTVVYRIRGEHGAIAGTCEKPCRIQTEVLAQPREEAAERLAMAVLVPRERLPCDSELARHAILRSVESDAGAAQALSDRRSETVRIRDDGRGEVHRPISCSSSIATSWRSSFSRPNPCRFSRSRTLS